MNLKNMKKYIVLVDLLIQSILIASLFYWMAFLLLGKGGGIALAENLFILGVWQYFGNLLYLLFMPSSERRFYCLLGFASIIPFGFVIPFLNETMGAIYAFIAYPGIAVWYWFITFKELKSIISSEN